jgi:hypothetical protein
MSQRLRSIRAPALAIAAVVSMMCLPVRPVVKGG